MSDYNGDSISEQEWDVALDQEFEEEQDYEPDYESDDPLTMALLNCGIIRLREKK